MESTFRHILTLAAAPPAGVADWPWTVHVAAAMALLIGMLIWLAGGRLMRPAFIALGALVGIAFAHLLPDVIAQWLSPWALSAVGAAVGALIGWLAFRVLVANTLALVIALVSTLAVAAFVKLPVPSGEPPATESTSSERAPATNPRTLEEWFASLQLNQLKESVGAAVEAAKARLDETADQPDDPDGPGSLADLTVERGSRAVKVFAARSWQQLVYFWNTDLDPRGRALLLLALVLGYLGGLVLGFALPKRAAAVTTAMIGPAVWMPAAAYGVVALGLPLASRIPTDPLVWLIAWAALAGVGLLFQLFFGKQRAAKPAA
ncbi:MAG: hypothetical protein JNK58_07545 [Phycisphaerae bacterium]|nr:hypothetical protein [Phycisphaerae bacterium]